MGDMGEVFDEMRKITKKRHQAFYKLNHELMKAQKFFAYTVRNSGETLCFRIPGKPRVDFYPSTGRWRNLETKIMHRGGGVAFLNWYHKQVMANDQEKSVSSIP